MLFMCVLSRDDAMVQTKYTIKKTLFYMLTYVDIIKDVFYICYVFTKKYVRSNVNCSFLL